MNGKVHATAGIVFGVASIALLNRLPISDAVGFSVTMNIEDILNKYNSGKFFDFTEGINALLVVASAWFGSLLPDIDHPTSTASKKMFLLSIPYRILQFVFGKNKHTKHFVGHRGITHSLLFMAIPIILMFLVFSNAYLDACMFGLCVGIFSHLFMDMLNPHGVPLFLPFVKKNFRLLPKKICIKTK